MSFSKSYACGLDVLGASNDMDTAFDVSRVVNKTLGGILNAFYPGVGTAAEKVTELWLDPLQVELTKKPVPKKPLTDAEKKVVAEKAIADALAAKVKAEASPKDAKLATEAKEAAQKAVSLAAEAKIFATPVDTKTTPVVPSASSPTGSVPSKPRPMSRPASDPSWTTNPRISTIA